jgi:hypothetical protein
MEAPIQRTEAPARPGPFSGRRLYSPRAIAAYSVIANPLVGAALIGLNLRVRGRPRLGAFVIGASIVGGTALLFTIYSMDHPAGIWPFGLLFGYVAYQIEKRPYAAAVMQGASSARWWPPALYLLALMSVLLGLELLWPR